MASSRAAVRTAIQNWIMQGTIPNLNQVLISFPKQINFQINATAGQLNRAAGVVHISAETETRVAIGGAYNGWKRVDYQIDFQIFHLSLEKKAEAGMDSFDIVVDGVKNLLRGGGHTLGLPDGSLIWEAAEASISANYGLPFTNDAGATEIWASISFPVTQMIQA